MSGLIGQEMASSARLDTDPRIVMDDLDSQMWDAGLPYTATDLELIRRNRHPYFQVAGICEDCGQQIGSHTECP